MLEMATQLVCVCVWTIIITYLLASPLTIVPRGVKSSISQVQMEEKESHTKNLVKGNDVVYYLNMIYDWWVSKLEWFWGFGLGWV